MKAKKKTTAIAVLALVLHGPCVRAQHPDLYWVRTIAGTDTLGYADDRAVAITHDISGNIIITGFFHGNTDLDPGPGLVPANSTAYTTSYVLKLNAAGAFVSGAGYGAGAGSAIASDATGNVYVTGYYVGTVDFDPGPQVTSLTAAGHVDVFVIKLSPAGNLLWARSLGGADADQSLGIACDALGNVYTTGYFEGTADFDPGSGVQSLVSAGDRDIFVSKLSAQGSFIWAKRFGGSGEENGNAITVNPPTFDVFLTGWFEGTADFDPGPATHQFTSAGNLDFFVLKLDVSGNLVWARQFGGTSTDRGNAIVMDPSGSGALLVAGSYYETVDFDPGAGTSNLTSLGQYDVFALKLDQAGNHIWSKSMGGPGFDYCYGVAADQNGSVYLTGQFSGTAHDYDPGTGVCSLTGNDDVFFVKLNSDGQFTWAGTGKGPGGDNGYGISVSSAGEACIAGSFMNTVDFDPGPGAHELTNSFFSGTDAFILKLRDPSTGIEESGAGQALIFPNPCDGLLHINGIKENAGVEITNLTGEIVFCSELTHSYNESDISNIPAGVYILTVRGITTVKVLKLIKQ